MYIIFCFAWIVYAVVILEYIVVYETELSSQKWYTTPEYIDIWLFIAAVSKSFSTYFGSNGRVVTLSTACFTLELSTHAFFSPWEPKHMGRFLRGIVRGTCISACTDWDIYGTFHPLLHHTMQSVGFKDIAASTIIIDKRNTRNFQAIS